MTVALLISSANEAAQLIPWGATFAGGHDTDFQIIVIRRSKDKRRHWKDIGGDDADSPTLKAIIEQLGLLGLTPQVTANEGEQDSSTQTPMQVSLKQFSDAEPGTALTEEINSLDISLLIIPAHSPSTSDQDETEWQQTLYRNVPCTAMYLRDDTKQKIDQLRIMVALTDTDEDAVALKFASAIAEHNNGSITAIYVAPEIDTVSREVGSRILERIARNALGKKADAINRRVVLGDNTLEAIRQSNADDYDLIVCGKRWHRDVRRILDGQLLQSDTATDDSPALATIRGGTPLTGRIMQTCQRCIEQYVPQLEREQRVELSTRIQTSSRWDFDFVALILLSTLIAALGLIQNSVAVVIGAMLVAPLMTPIVATGLGLAQANLRLMHVGVRTVFRGFATAFALGMVVGWLGFPDTIPSEIHNRAHPNINDLVIAFVSGIAAAYALGRPNLLSALPGVAIAAALVPPLAVSGMAIAVGQFTLGLGALLLFLTNIVAITLGTTLTFRAVGIRTVRKEGVSAPMWPRFLLVLLVVLSLLLAGLMSFFAEQKAKETRKAQELQQTKQHNENDTGS